MIRSVYLDSDDRFILFSIPFKEPFSRFDFSEVRYLDECDFDSLYNHLDWSKLTVYHTDFLIRLSYMIFGRDNLYLYTRLFYSN